MNLTEFAEQIVFGKTLEEKLWVPGKLTDDGVRTGPRVDSLIAPSRPVGLEMKHGRGGNVQPPSDDKLENEHARGQLLHFLANHELLATELMALVLLKFPDAPAEFRQGILATLREEQQHTLMYIRRMKACGVEFGRFPLSGQFWRMIEPMQSPMDFVSRLSLTFEQANLDYSLHFAGVFRRIGDVDTAKLLQQIYEDEIGHVQHGLHWFRQWKNPEQSDWDAYQDALEFPMSPQRALGPRALFNRDGRVQAGLTDDFIDSIEVYRQSRGRTPTVRWFDPAAEAELAGGLSRREVPMMEQVGRDLELVMVPLARQDDVVLVRRLPSRELRKQLLDLGFDLPQFVLLDQRSSLSPRMLNGFSPWAWTPANHEIAGTLAPSAQVPPQPWQPEMAELFRKSWATERLLDAFSRADDARPEWFVSRQAVGVPVSNLDEIGAALTTFATAGYKTAIFKQDFGTSGRGQRRLECNRPLDQKDLAWLQSVFKLMSDTSEPMGVVEPELDRVLDLSFLWRIEDGSRSDLSGPHFLGWTRQLATAGRRYAGTRLGTPLSDCDDSIRRFLLSHRGARLQAIADWLEAEVVQKLADRGFTGELGVDALVCRDADGEFKVKPLVELNPRTTMGHVALNFTKRLAPGVPGEFRILARSEWEQFHAALDSVSFEKVRDGRWKSGVVWLGEVNAQTKLVPVLLVGNAAIEIVAKR